jgi:hypothetical protein
MMLIRKDALLLILVRNGQQDHNLRWLEEQKRIGGSRIVILLAAANPNIQKLSS